jgi:hypothetical protein
VRTASEACGALHEFMELFLILPPLSCNPSVQCTIFKKINENCMASCRRVKITHLNTVFTAAKYYFGLARLEEKRSPGC